MARRSIWIFFILFFFFGRCFVSSLSLGKLGKKGEKSDSSEKGKAFLCRQNLGDIPHRLAAGDVNTRRQTGLVFLGAFIYFYVLREILHLSYFFPLKESTEKSKQRKKPFFLFFPRWLFHTRAEGHVFSDWARSLSSFLHHTNILTHTQWFVASGSRWIE